MLVSFGDVLLRDHHDGYHRCNYGEREGFDERLYNHSFASFDLEMKSSNNPDSLQDRVV